MLLYRDMERGKGGTEGAEGGVRTQEAGGVGGWRKLLTEELYDSHWSQNIIKVIQ
jgi:hypothetical protein